MTAYIIPALILGGCGILAGALLTVAARIFHVEVDERIEKIGEALPQANCGACGFAGCADYAAAIVNKGAAADLCRPGGAEAAARIAAVLGIAAAEVVPMTAVVHCNGSCDVTQKAFSFDGVQSCKAVKRFYGGNGMCKYGCIGLGDCVSVCGYEAIKVVNGVARVTPALCASCGRCVSACPNGIISIKPLAKHIDVLCSSKDSGKDTKLNCKSGCIGCRICEKKCPVGAITVKELHAAIDYDKCTSCGACMAACPMKVIVTCSVLT